MTYLIRRASFADIDGIYRVLSANKRDSSLFQQLPAQIERTLSDFVVVESDQGRIAACSALHWHCDDIAEILAVAVDPALHGAGLGSALIERLISDARSACARLIWLSTSKPSYFARFGFQPVSRWELPLGVLIHKLLLVFQQLPSRWLPAIAGRHQFMAFASPATST